MKGFNCWRIFATQIELEKEEVEGQEATEEQNTMEHLLVVGAEYQLADNMVVHGDTKQFLMVGNLLISEDKAKKKKMIVVKTGFMKPKEITKVSTPVLLQNNMVS